MWIHCSSWSRPSEGGKLSGVPYNFGRSSGTKGKGKMRKGLGFQTERGEQRKFVDTVIGVCESGTKKPSVGLNKST